jgi:hypothetical protein
MTMHESFRAEHDGVQKLSEGQVGEGTGMGRNRNERGSGAEGEGEGGREGERERGREGEDVWRHYATSSRPTHL